MARLVLQFWNVGPLEDGSPIFSDLRPVRANDTALRDPTAEPCLPQDLRALHHGYRARLAREGAPVGPL